MGAMFDDWRARSPFYDETHDAVAESVRRFIAAEATPNIDAWERAGSVPADFHRKAGTGRVCWASAFPRLTEESPRASTSSTR